MTTLPPTMHAVVLTGHGSYDQLSYRHDIAVPQPAAGEVLVRVSACGLNNTDVNTRIGWYASEVRGATTAERTSEPAGEDGLVASGGWSDGLVFPRIQGADVCGVVVGAGQTGSAPTWSAGVC